MRRHRLPLTVALLASAFTAPARAAVPFFNASCPGGLDVHADEGGPVYVQGRETTLKRFNDRYFEARDASSGTTLSISTGDDGTPQVSYTGRGVTVITNMGAANPQAAALCVRDVARRAGLTDLTIAVVTGDYECTTRPRMSRLTSWPISVA